MKWDLDFIGTINPPSSIGHRWVLMAIDYFTKLTKVVALKDANESVVLNFYEDLVCRFGVLDLIILNNALAFARNKISKWAIGKDIYLNTSSNYYLQGNGQAKSTNKNLICIIKRTLEGNQHSWHEKLKLALWTNNITPKISIGISTYTLVYGKEARIPVSIELPALDFMY